MTTKTSTPILRALGLSVPLFAWSVALHAQTAATTTTTTTTTDTTVTDEAVKLPEFNVTDVKADPYKSDDVLSVARIAGSIMDAPFTVNVVSPELLNDLGAAVGYDVNRYFAGVSNGRGSGGVGINERQNFQQDGRRFLRLRGPGLVRPPGPV